MLDPDTNERIDVQEDDVLVKGRTTIEVRRAKKVLLWNNGEPRLQYEGRIEQLIPVLESLLGMVLDKRPLEPGPLQPFHFRNRS